MVKIVAVITLLFIPIMYTVIAADTIIKTSATESLVKRYGVAKIRMFLFDTLMISRNGFFYLTILQYLCLGVLLIG